MRPNKEGVIFTPVVWQVFQVLSLQELLKYGPAHPLAGVSYTSMSDHSKDFDGVNRAHQLIISMYVKYTKDGPVLLRMMC